MALLMVLAVSIVTRRSVAVARSEALSSMSYTSMSQVRYGAESGSTRRRTICCSRSAADCCQRDGSVRQLRHDGVAGALSTACRSCCRAIPPSRRITPPRRACGLHRGVTGSAERQHRIGCDTAARATLMSMQVLTDYYTLQPVTLQTWEITGVGRVNGPGASQVEVSSILERRQFPCSATRRLQRTTVAMRCALRVAQPPRATTRAFRSSEARPLSLNQAATSAPTATLTETVVRPRSTARSQRRAQASATAHRTT